MKSGLVSSVVGLCLLAGAPVYAQTAPKPPVVQKPPGKSAPAKAKPRPSGDGAPAVKRATGRPIPPNDIEPPPPIPVPPVAKRPPDVVNTAYNAQSGIVRMQYALGSMYHSGRDVPQDTAAAVAWLGKAAGRDYAPAQFDLGLMYVVGDGVAKDDAAGMALVQKAADQGFGVAQNYVGRRYAQGVGGTQDYVQAYMWMDLAAHATEGRVWGPGGVRPQDELAAKMTPAQITAAKALAVAWQPGAPSVGQRLNTAEAAIWSGRAEVAVQTLLPLAADGNPDALFMLGKMYLLGIGTARTDQGAVVWLRKAADHGHVGAQYLLGGLYMQGRGVATDIPKAVDLTGKAAGAGMFDAEDTMGLIYANGVGVQMNAVTAAAWFRKAADQGEGHAQYMLAMDYSTGNGIPVDKSQAYKWASLAAIYVADDTPSARGLVDGRLKDDALAVKANLAGQLTPEQVTAIDAEVKAWRPVFQVF